jgi:hypothetical protein
VTSRAGTSPTRNSLRISGPDCRELSITFFGKMKASRRQRVMAPESSKSKRTTAEKLRLFGERFSGLLDVYGTYDPVGRVYQVKEAVTDDVFLAHLSGSKPYGVYLLTGEVTRAIVADFDAEDLPPPLDFISAAKHYGIACYLEKSKRKGYHAWSFADKNGITAAKARAVFRHTLGEIGMSKIEIFPKQDRIPVESKSFGNFINAPLFGKLVPAGRTVFLKVSDGSLDPYPDQWALLENVELIQESLLDDIIEVNDVPVGTGPVPHMPTTLGTFLPLPGSLPLCARRMLEEGVTSYQRDSCFRLAVQLRKVGIPYDLAVETLLAWSQKNRPIDGKRIITEQEIRSQTYGAYFTREYHGCGCDHSAVQPFCAPSCPIRGITNEARVRGA